MAERELSEDDARARAEALISSADVVCVATNGSHGHPNIRPMAPVRTEGTSAVWFITHIESSKIIELIKDRSATICGVSSDSGEIVRLWCTVDILDDRDSRAHIWSDELTGFFPGGQNDPNMRVLKFSVVSGSYERGEEYGAFSN